MLSLTGGGGGGVRMYKKLQHYRYIKSRVISCTLPVTITGLLQTSEEVTRTLIELPT